MSKRLELDLLDDALSSEMLNGAPQSFIDIHIPKEIKQFKYSARRFIIGNNPFTGEHVSINATEAFRAYMMAQTRTGKTFIMRRIMDQVVNADLRVAILPDAKNEFQSSLKQIQEKYIRKLPEGDIPKGLKMKIYRPLFFSKFDNGKLPKNNTRVSLSLKDLNIPEMQTLCNYGDFSERQKTDFKDLLDIMEREDRYSVDDIKIICEENSFSMVWDKIKFLVNCGLFDSRFTVDPVEVLKEGYVLALNYDGFDTLDLSNNSMDQIFLSVWLRMIIQARKDGKFKNLVIFNDESARWVPNTGDPTCKPLIMTSVERDAAYGISWLFGIQDKSSVPKRLLDQCRFQFIPYNVKKEVLSQVLIENQVIIDMLRDKKKYIEIYKKLNHKFRWLIIDTNQIGEDKLTYVDVYPPTSAHQETKNSF